MEGFNELFHKLREAHEREVESWQEKVQELSNKKGCDIKRMEELFNRNQQMREQHRLLTENIKSLENRLRAGLCDRCTVTQEVAKRRQQEYEASQIQSLQHISILAAEMNNTKKENKRLREEVRSLRGVLDGQSEHSSNSTTPEGKPARSPDLSPSAEPVALITTANSKADMQPGGGAVAVKTETDQRTEENMSERRQPRVWNRSNFESYKPLHLYPEVPASWKTEQDRSLIRRVSAERRTQTAEGVEQRQPISPSMPPHLLLLKNLAASSSSPSAPGEAKLGRHLLHAPVPCRPRPIKSSHAPLPWTLSEASDWAGMATSAGSSPVVQSGPKPSLPRFPNLIPTSQHANHGSQHAPGRRQVSVHGWPKQSPPQPQSKEQSLVFRVRGLSEQQNSPAKPQERKEEAVAQWRPAAPQPERTYGEGVRELNDGPLDLSDRGSRSKSITSPKDDDEPILVSEGEREEGGSDRDTKTHSPCTPPSSQQQEHNTSDYNKTEEDVLVIREDTNVKTDQTNGKKVPVLTISLRPVVLLESLNAGLLKQESSSSNGKSPSTADPGSSSEEQDRGDSPGTESSQGSKRKRRQDTDTDRDSDTDGIQQERKIKIVVGPKETSPNYTGQG